MKKAAFFLPVILLYTVSVTAQKTEQVKWMIGTWKINMGNNMIVEEWHIADDSTLSGKSYFIKNGTDTIPQETIELSYRKGEWYYTPTVKNQNNAQPVPFKIIFLKGTEFISENPTHDFPQRIAYRRIKNQLFASIEGKRNGKHGKQNFDFVAE
jgi:hypothetical protein